MDFDVPIRTPSRRSRTERLAGMPSSPLIPSEHSFEHPSPTDRLCFQIETEAVAAIAAPPIVQSARMKNNRNRPVVQTHAVV